MTCNLFDKTINKQNTKYLFYKIADEEANRALKIIRRLNHE